MSAPIVARSLSASREDSGFTLVEVLVAIALLAVGVLGVGFALTLQSGVSGGADFGVAAVSRGNTYSTAAMLAQARIENMKSVEYAQATSANFTNEAYGAIAGYPSFRRTVDVQTDSPDPGTKTITVQVFFRPEAAGGQGAETSVILVTILGKRP